MEVNKEEIEIMHMSPNAQGLEMWIATYGNKIVGHIFMMPEAGNKIKFLDAWVDTDYRRNGIYRMLWEARWEYIKNSARYKGYRVYAWCKPKSLPLLIEKGFSTEDTATYVETTI